MCLIIVCEGVYCVGAMAQLGRMFWVSGHHPWAVIEY